MLVHPLILAGFAAVSLQSVNGQLTTSSPTTCPRTDCCEEDCCGPGTTWVAPNCVTSPGALGYDGNYYSSEYESGCAFRECCDGDCCGPSTVFNSDSFCVPAVPTSEPSATPSFTMSPTSCPNDVDSSCPWTAWLDRDNPTGTGDWENLSSFVVDGNPVCNGEEPLAIECQAFGTRSGATSPITLPVDASETGETIVCNTCRGFWCADIAQDDRVCNYDYRVRFKCPCGPTQAPAIAPSLQTTSQSPTSEDNCTSSTVGNVYINSCEEKCECEETAPGQYETVCCREREEFTCMPLARRQRFIDTYISAVATDPVMQQLVDSHSWFPVHSNPKYFLPWHRWYIMAIEDRLRKKDCRVTVPWWKWEKHSVDWQTSPPFFPPGAPHWLGGDGAGPSQCVDMGPFATPWTPGGPSTVASSLVCLERNFRQLPMPSVSEVAALFGGHPVSGPELTKFTAFATEIEGSLHVTPHIRIRGTVGTASRAAKSPEFFLHHAHIDQIWDRWQRLTNPVMNHWYGFGDENLDLPITGTIPGSDTPRTVAYHLHLKKSGVVYVKEKTSITPSPLPPQCCWSYTGGGGGGGGGEDYYDQVYNLDEIEEAIYELAVNDTLYDIPQRPTYVPTIEELKNGFFWTSSEGSDLTDGFREETLIERREKIIAVNEALQFPTTEFQDDTSTMLGIDVGAIIARFNICPLGSEWIPATGRCSAVNQENQTLIQNVLDNSVFFLGDIVKNEDVGADPPSESPTGDPSLAPTPITIMGTVLEDTNNDDVGDVGLSGVVLTLIDVSGVSVATMLTDADGNYGFFNFPPGEWTVVQTNVPGYIDVSDIDGGDPNSIAVDTTTGVSSAGNDFVCRRSTASISGRVSEDVNNDNVGDIGLSGVFLTLFDDDGNAVGSSVTGSNGVYTFDVPPGTWTVVQTNLAGYIDVSDSDGGDPNTITVDTSAGDSTNNDFVCRLGDQP